MILSLSRSQFFYCESCLLFFLSNLLYFNFVKTIQKGRIDEQGYLFISGRSKEVINKGGETISPFEIEEVLLAHPSIREVLAFSFPHELYQETVGVVIVTPANMPRVDLFGLHNFLEGRLHRSKWPQAIIYMGSLPKNQVRKYFR